MGASSGISKSMLKKAIKKITPAFALSGYHFALALLAHIVYGFPSRRLIVIGVTGTKGKTTTCNMIWKILSEAGFKTGMTTTANFRIGGREWVNDTKMTMQGRFSLQKIIKRMADAGCRYAVIETSSEGIAQYRHWGIKYQIAVLTNLSPEHIDRHGTFEKYKQTKAKLFRKLSGQRIAVINNDDASAEYFRSLPARKRVTYSMKNTADIIASQMRDQGDGFTFSVMGTRFTLPLLGLFNVYNALAAIAVGISQDIEIGVAARALKTFSYVPGRMEEIVSDNGFSVFVDYAHTPESLRLVYTTLKPRAKRLIAVLGSAGGGRDRWRRPQLGELAAKYADVAIVTNEDPYDEDPKKIIDEVWQGLQRSPIERYKIFDREEAIKKAISLACSGDIVVVTGKGSEQHIVTAHGKIPWDDRKVVKRYVGKSFSFHKN